MTEATELTPFCILEDTEAFLKHPVPAALEDYEARKRMMASNVLRLLMQNEGRDADKEYEENALMHDMLRDTVAVSVAIDIRREQANLDSGQDLSPFSSFTQSAGGYTFTGEWRGNAEDVFFTSNQLKNLGIGRPTIRRFSV